MGSGDDCMSVQPKIPVIRKAGILRSIGAIEALKRLDE
jgi:hypothetical protein